VYAGTLSHLLIKHAALEEDRQGLLKLNSSIDVVFSDAIKETLHKGFTLHYVLEFQLSLPVKYWFNNEIVTITEPMSLTYHPLSRQYILVQNGLHQSFSTLDDVAASLEPLSPIDVLNKAILEADEPYEAVLLMRLQYKKLPSALQKQAKNSESWKMTSQRFEWKPELFK